MPGKLDTRQVASISPSATKLDIRTLTLKSSRTWWMSSEQRMQLRIPPNFVENYFHSKYIAMKKCYYAGYTFKLCTGSWGPTFKFWKWSRVPLLNFEGCSGSRGPGPTFTPCLATELLSWTFHVYKSIKSNYCWYNF